LAQERIAPIDNLGEFVIKCAREASEQGAAFLSCSWRQRSNTRNNLETITWSYINGDRDSIVQVERWIGNVVTRFHGLRSSRDDIIQEVHERLVRNLFNGAFRGDCSFKTYVERIALYVCVDETRRTRPTVSLEEVGTSHVSADCPTPLETVIVEETRKLCNALLLELEPEDVELLKLRFFKRMKYREISRLLGIPEGTVKSRLSRCCQKAKRLLGFRGNDTGDLSTVKGYDAERREGGD